MHLIYINITKNNIIISVTTAKGDVILQKNAITSGSKNRDINSYDSSITTGIVIGEELKLKKIKVVGIYFRGVTKFKKITLEGILEIVPHLTILFISDVTGIPHNGCTLSKKKRKKIRRSQK